MTAVAERAVGFRVDGTGAVATKDVDPGRGDDPTNHPELVVDLQAIASNVRRISGRTRAKVMAVVKADAFGHGAVEVARTALVHGATWLGVTGVGEALELRAAGLRAPVLSWLNAVGADVATALGADVDLGIPSVEHLAAVSAVASASAAGAPARVHLHLDVGMSRDGADPAGWARLCREARAAERAGVVEVVGVMGHLGCADDLDDPHNAAQRARFDWGVDVAASCGLRPRHRHLAGTAATLTEPGTHHTLVRVGAGVVGIDPSGTTTLRGAMTLRAPLVTVRRVEAGAGVGYGHTWVAPTARWLGLVALGYADGLPRAAGNRAEVLVAGRRRTVVGRVSMDQVVVDLGDASRVPVTGVPAPGATVTVFGPGSCGEPTVADWARWGGTIEHDLVTGIGRRVRRLHVGRPEGRR